MGYTKDDELAINTIRLLAVSWTPLLLLHEAPRRAGSFTYLEFLEENRHTLQYYADVLIFSRSMPHLKPTPATPARPWVWHQSPMLCSTNS